MSKDYVRQVHARYSLENLRNSSALIALEQDYAVPTLVWRYRELPNSNKADH